MIQDLETKTEALDRRIKVWMSDLQEEDIRRINHLMADLIILQKLGIVLMGPDVYTLLCEMKPRVRRYHNMILKGNYRR